MSLRDYIDESYRDRRFMCFPWVDIRTMMLQGARHEDENWGFMLLFLFLFIGVLSCLLKHFFQSSSAVLQKTNSKHTIL